MRASYSHFSLLEFVLVLLGFLIPALAIPFAYPDQLLFPPDIDLLIQFFIFAIAYWIIAASVRIFEGPSSPFPGLVLWCMGTGSSLLVEAVLIYLLLVERTSIQLIVIANGLTTLLLWAAHRYRNRKAQTPAVLMLGFDHRSLAVVHALGYRLAGIVASPPVSHPAFFGEFDRLEAALDQLGPTHLLFSRLAAAEVLNSGLGSSLDPGKIVLLDSAKMFEDLFGRVSCPHLRTTDLLLSPNSRIESKMMALQAIYTNLIGLALLLLALPLLLVIALLIRLFSGPGPAVESVECAGFQKIPFRLFHFRTRRRDTFELTWPGRLITRLGLVNLPHLFNVVRGEIVLFGPHPVRIEFARRLAALLPLYSHRFTVKPGIFDWAQLYSSPDSRLQDERLRLEYDLYYVKYGSLALDAEILLRKLSRRDPPSVTAVSTAAIAP